MSDIEISQTTTQTASDITNLYLAGIDLTKPSGSQNRKINASQMLGAYMASNGAGGGKYYNSAIGVTVPVNGFTDSLLYTPTSGLVDVALLNVYVAQNGIATQNCYFQIYAGVPSGSGYVVYDSSIINNILVGSGTNIITTATANLNSTLYIPAAAGSTTLYIRMYNVGQSTLTYSFAANVLEYPNNGIALPVYQAPPPYLGALMSTVHVGPTQEFIEPQYGLQALADGGTMLIDNGHYYLGIGFANPTSNVPITIPNYGGTTANNPNRFTHVTVTGTSPYGTVMDGRGGFGAGHRLTQGKGIIWTSAQITISNVGFVNGGGADNTGDAESGLYIDNPAEASSHTVSNCRFDNCEDGIFCPGGPGGSSASSLNTLQITNCDFGLISGNGVTSDGLSHDVYLEANSTTMTGCHHFGAKYGNNVKNRGFNLTLNGSFYNSAGGGRCIDFPSGGTLTVSNGTLTSNPEANFSFLGYADENDSGGIINPVFTNCTIIGTRSTANVWVGQATGTFEFVSCTQQWWGYNTFTPMFICNRNQSSYIQDSTVTSGFFIDAAAGGTQLTSPPVVPGSIAQPGYVP